MTGGPQHAFLPDGRLHLHHGPIDLIIGADGSPEAVRRAMDAAWARFRGLLQELVDELAVLRRPLRREPVAATGRVARRMIAACRPYRSVFITPMAAVAGAVADEVLGAMLAEAELERAYVNDGGDIAFHLAPGARLTAGLVADLALPSIDGTIELRHELPARGLATSGWRGRSLSLGIADAVTVLAADAAAADAAATLIANAVTVEDPAVRRLPAHLVRDDTDLGDLPVTVEVGRLPPDAVRRALDAGVERAREFEARGLILGAVIVLQGACRASGPPPLFIGDSQEEQRWIS